MLALFRATLTLGSTMADVKLSPDVLNCLMGESEGGGDIPAK